MIEIPLQEQSVNVHASKALCFEVVASAGKLIEKRSKDEKVVEFTTDHQGDKIRTVELLKLSSPDRIEYSWLEGPLPRVEEEIVFIERDGETVIEYRGSFWMKGWRGWLAGRLRVKPVFDRQVMDHLVQAKEISEARAARSRTHPRRRTSDTVKIYDEDFGPTGPKRRQGR